MKGITAIFLSWGIPGAGHWHLGHKKKAGFYFLMISSLFLAGMVIADFRNISLDRHPYFFLGTYIWNGGATLVAWLATHNMSYVQQLELKDFGCLYSAVAGLLNLLVMIDAYLLATGYTSNATDH